MSIASSFDNAPALRSLEALVRRTLKPAPRQRLSQWAEAHRVLSVESSAKPGRWKNRQTPYLVKIMDCFNDVRVQKIVIQSASQVGKTEVLINALGYLMHREPCPILVLFPSLSLVRTFSEKRIKPMLRDTPELSALVSEAKERDSGQTIEEKSFPGGYVTMTTCSSAPNLSARPIRVVAIDEYDRAPDSAGDEGDVVGLAEKRTETFANAKIMVASTPVGSAETSKTAKLYASSKRFILECPCPGCGEFFEWLWEQVEWDDERPETARIVCPTCGEKTTDGQRNALVRRGRWLCLDPDVSWSTVGFHMKGLVSPWVRLAKLVDRFLKARGNPFKMKVFFNTDLGETWEGEAQGLVAGDIYAGREDYELAPPEVLCVTAGVDIGDDHAHVDLVGWGTGAESWALDYVRHMGNPETEEFWEELDNILWRRFATDDGRDLAVAASCIDSGGHSTQKVYDFVRGKTHRRIFAIKGVRGWGKPLVGSVSKKRTGRQTRNVNLYPLCVSEGKMTVYGRLKLKPGPGACHFPRTDAYDRDYFNMLTAEKVRLVVKRGYVEKEWFLPEHRRNEALDARVYATAAFILLRPNLEVLAKKAEHFRRSKTRKKTNKKAPPNPAAASGNWVTRGTSWEAGVS